MILLMLQSAVIYDDIMSYGNVSLRKTKLRVSLLSVSLVKQVKA